MPSDELKDLALIIYAEGTFQFYPKKDLDLTEKGVLLKDILAKVEIDMPNPKLLSEFYITCIASDNYKVVFSWNEIFNIAIGKHALIITELDGKKALDMDDSIVLLCNADYATGRRYVKGLQKIIIERVQ